MNKSSDNPVVSICCVTFNHKEFIKEAIEGFLLQKTTFPIEIIIHDDASTDGTTEIIRSYEKKFPLVIKPIYQKENQWSKGKRITPIAISRAKGKYVALCEGDDYWTDPMKLQKQVDFLNGNCDFAGCFHTTQQIYFPSGKLGKIYGQTCPDIVNTQDTLSLYSLFHTSSFLFRRLCLTLPDWFTSVTSGDMALFSIISKSGSLKKIDCIMSVYRKHEGGVTSNNALIRNYHQQRIELMKHLDEFHQYKYTDKAQSIIASHQRALDDSNYGNKKNFFKATYRKLIAKLK